MKHHYFLTGLFIFLYFLPSPLSAQKRPNILVVIADDMGVDAMSAYGIGTEQPNTPVLDSLINEGLLFKNAWGHPTCSPSRAAMLTGLNVSKNGVTTSSSDLELTHVTLFEQIAAITGNDYADAAFGKWHLGGNNDLSNPNDQGADRYVGHLSSGVDDYFDWERTEDGVRSDTTDYVTTHITQEAIDWIGDQTQPWFVWMAHNAPHEPHHLPPDTLYTRTQTGGKLNRFLCMIESVDHEIGRILNSMTPAERDSTLVIFAGDNGTPNAVLQSYPSGQGKSTLYEGGIRVPFLMAGYGVDRKNEVEEGLVCLRDMFATITEVLETNLPGGTGNSFSLLPLLSDANAPTRAYNYSEIDPATGANIAIREEQYKMIVTGGEMFFFDLLNDSLETTNLLDGALTTEQTIILKQLQSEAEMRAFSWSCLDDIQNGEEIAIDEGALCNNCLPAKYLSGNVPRGDHQTEQEIYSNGVVQNMDTVVYAAEQIDLDTGFQVQLGAHFTAEIDPCQAGINDVHCPNDNSTSLTDIGCNKNPTVPNVYTESVSGATRTINSNNYPNHIYQLKQNDTIVPVSRVYEMPAEPMLAASVTNVTSDSGQPRWWFGIGLNGVILAPAPATPFIFENPNTGEYNWDWVFEPTVNKGNGPDKVALDCSSAHAGDQGYHYHGNMVEFAETFLPGVSANTVPTEPIQIGWAADGFPIVYRYAPDGFGGLALLQPSYRIKEGLRPGDGVYAPCGEYNGKYTRDYEYVDGLGDLDECNGIERDITLPTVEGNKTFSYFYVVTDAYPQVSRCMSGTPDPSFN